MRKDKSLKFIKDLRPSLCSHLDKDIPNGKECVKCGRKKIEKQNTIFFYLKNGVHYFTKLKK